MNIPNLRSGCTANFKVKKYGGNVDYPHFAGGAGLDGSEDEVMNGTVVPLHPSPIYAKGFINCWVEGVLPEA
jgi:hypothetical protein